MFHMSLEKIAQAIGGKLVNPSNACIHNNSIDNRMIEKGCLFIAIRGENFDGHNFIESAFSQGAAAAVTEREIGTQRPYILVEDTKGAFLALAKKNRELFRGTVVGITGSVGKTTTKEMTAAVLSCRYKTLKTPGNLNNSIGLPRTLCSLDETHRAAVIEMGMSSLGEISALSRTAAPDIGVITTIGTSHLQQLGSRENILRAKLEILDGMSKGTPLIVNADQPFLENLPAGKYAEPVLSHPIIRCGIENENVDYRAASIIADHQHTVFEIIYQNHAVSVTLPVLGKHHVMDALLAFAAGKCAGISDEDAANALARYQPVGMRQKMYEISGMTVIADCYNASPESVRAAFDSMKEIAVKGRKIAVLADMLELGDYAEKAHFAIGEYAEKAGIDALFCYGDYAAYIAEGAKNISDVFTSSSEEKLYLKLKEYIQPGDIILFKGSRGMHLENMMNRLLEELK